MRLFASTAALALVTGCSVLTSLEGLGGSSQGNDAGDATSTADSPQKPDAALTYPGVVLEDGPVAYFRLGEKAGPTLSDQALGGVAALLPDSGVTLGAPGAIANDPDTAVSFSGTQWISAPLQAIGGRAPFTLEAWVKPTAVNGTAAYSISQEFKTGVKGQQGYGIYTATGPGLVFERYFNDTPSQVASIKGLPATFSYIVATYDGAEMSLYVDAQLQGQYATVNQTPTGGELDIGVFFTGSIDEVAIYPSALSASRVLVHYQVGTGQ